MVPDVRSLERGAVGGLGLRRAEADSASGGMHGQLHAVRRERDGEPHSACVRFPGSKTMYPAGVTITARRGRLDTRARSSGRCTQGERRACPVPGPRYAGKRRMALARLPRRAQLHLHLHPRAPCRVGHSLGPGTGRGTAVGRHTIQGTVPSTHEATTSIDCVCFWRVRTGVGVPIRDRACTPAATRRQRWVQTAVG